MLNVFRHDSSVTIAGFTVTRAKDEDYQYTVRNVFGEIVFQCDRADQVLFYLGKQVP